MGVYAILMGEGPNRGKTHGRKTENKIVESSILK